MVKKIGVLVVVLAVVAVGWWYWSPQSDRSLVMKALREMADAASKERNETTAAMWLKTRKADEYLADPCSFQLERTMFSGEFSPEEITSNLVRLRRVFNTCRLSFYDAEVTFPQPDRAIIDFTGNLQGELRNGEKVDEVREIRAELSKIKEQWRFCRFSIRQVIRK
ncbi:MAG: hypothetical protein PHQ27_05210 [Victivallales bacterium]|nr:hypothetical protein [Victivallales bacterium]